MSAVVGQKTLKQNVAYILQLNMPLSDLSELLTDHVHRHFGMFTGLKTNSALMCFGSGISSNGADTGRFSVWKIKTDPGWIQNENHCCPPERIYINGTR